MRVRCSSGLRARWPRRLIASPPSTDPSTPCPRPPDSQRLPRIASHRHKASWLLVAAAILALALGLHGPIAQWASYHAFADARAWLGLPNAQNVLSNLPFALLGLWGRADAFALAIEAP